MFLDIDEATSNRGVVCNKRPNPDTENGDRWNIITIYAVFQALLAYPNTVKLLLELISRLREKKPMLALRLVYL